MKPLAGGGSGRSRPPQACEAHRLYDVELSTSGHQLAALDDLEGKEFSKNAFSKNAFSKNAFSKNAFSKNAFSKNALFENAFFAFFECLS